MMMMWEMEAEDVTEHLGPIRNWQYENCLQIIAYPAIEHILKQKKKEIQLKKKNYIYFNQHPSLLKNPVISIKSLKTNTEGKKKG